MLGVRAYPHTYSGFLTEKVPYSSYLIVMEQCVQRSASSLSDVFKGEERNLVVKVSHRDG